MRGRSKHNEPRPQGSGATQLPMRNPAPLRSRLVIHPAPTHGRSLGGGSLSGVFGGALPGGPPGIFTYGFVVSTTTSTIGGSSFFGSSDFLPAPLSGMMKNP